MKKFISLFLILSLIFCFAACGGNETPDENSGNNIVNNVDDNQNADNITSNKEITLEDVENAPVSPESDFHYYDVDGGIEVVYDGVCLDKTSMKKFSDVVKKQAKEYHASNNKKPWRVVRIFDELGNQIAQES